MLLVQAMCGLVTFSLARLLHRTVSHFASLVYPVCHERTSGYTLSDLEPRYRMACIVAWHWVHLSTRLSLPWFERRYLNARE